MDLAVVAAFTAAGLSLVNVGISAQMSRRSQLDQWRRDVELPAVARLLTLSNDTSKAWQVAASQRFAWISSLHGDRTAEDLEAQGRYTTAFQEASDLYERIRFETAQLRIIAGAPLQAVTIDLAGRHEAAQHIVRPASGADDFREACYRYCSEIATTQERLVSTARLDLRVDRAGARSWRRLREARRRWRGAPRQPRRG